MHKYVRSSDYFPTPFRHQYRYFYPTPVLPTVHGTHRTHFCDSFAHGGHAHDLADGRRDRETLAKIMSGGGDKSATAMREYSLKKVLPWRATPLDDVDSDTSFHTGRNIRFNGDSDIFGTRLIDRFPNLVTGSNVMAAHGQQTYTRCSSKHSPIEWTFNNQQLCTGAECAHNKVIMLKAEAKQCVSESGKNAVRCKVDSAKEIEQRLTDIKSWIKSLQEELKYNIAQAHELLEIKERVEYMLKNIEQPLEIAQENLYTRETRQGQELVHDSVEDCLLREIETLRKAEEKLLDEMDRLNSQLAKLRATRHEIELDIRNKEQALHTDECVRLLTELSNEIGNVDIPQRDGSLSSPNSWMANAEALIQKSHQERNASLALYVAVSRLMLSSADECFGAWYSTNGAFNTRINEVLHARKHLERHHHKLKHDSESLKRHIEEVRKALDEKRPQLQLAQTRLEKRKERPGVELCRDQVMMTLLKETHVLKIAVDALVGKLSEMENTLQQLLKTKGAVEHDLKLKDVALFVDREKCLCLRQTFPISTFKESRHANPNGPSGEDAPMVR